MASIGLLGITPVLRFLSLLLHPWRLLLTLRLYCPWWQLLELWLCGPWWLYSPWLLPLILCWWAWLFLFMHRRASLLRRGAVWCRFVHVVITPLRRLRACVSRTALLVRRRTLGFHLPWTSRR